MIIDCDHCAARPTACSDCVVGVLLGTPEVPAGRAAAGAPSGAPREPGGPLPVEFGPVEQRALEVLADHGLIPRLRLVATPVPPTEPAPGTPGPGRRVEGPAAHRTRDVG